MGRYPQHKPLRHESDSPKVELVGYVVPFNFMVTFWQHVPRSILRLHGQDQGSAHEVPPPYWVMGDLYNDITCGRTGKERLSRPGKKITLCLLQGMVVLAVQRRSFFGMRSIVSKTSIFDVSGGWWSRSRRI